MRSISDASWLTSDWIAVWSSAAERAVLVLHGQLADALEHRVDLVEGALSRLHHRDAVLDVALGLGETADLATHASREIARPAASSAARLMR